MTNGSERAGGATFAGPAGSYGWESSKPDGSRDQTRRIGRTLWVAVVVLGLATFAVGFRSPIVLGFPVHLAVLAATVAVAGLLPGQKGGGWIAVALALTGFLDALAAWITAGEPGWAMTVIFALNALQSLAAIGALLVEARSRQSATIVDGQQRSAYDGFVAAYQSYAAQYQQAASQYYSAGQASAQAHATAEAPADTADSEGSPAESAQEALRAKYAHYGGYSTAEGSANSTRPSSTGSSADPGLPEANHIGPHSQPHRMAPPHPGRASST